MNSITLLGSRMVQKISYCLNISRILCNQPFHCDGDDNGDRNGFELVEEPLKKMCVDTNESDDSSEDVNYNRRKFSPRIRLKMDVERVVNVFGQDDPMFDFGLALDELHIKPSVILVREVLFVMLKRINCENKGRCAKLAYKFFVWCSQQEGYRHTANSYNLIMQIFAECEELKAMWRLVDEMIENGVPATARTFNILICTCSEAGFARRLVVKFVKSKSFNYRPFKHSYNAILQCLLVLNQYKLIEWVYQQMLLDGFSSDILTYNIVMFAKYRLGKLYQFHRLLDEMNRHGLSPDFHTYNILLHVLGKGDKPLAALNLLSHMRETGMEPTVLHFTTLIDGLSRAGNLDACDYFFDEMIKNGCMPDVVAYTVMITGYVVAGEFQKAQEMFNEMISRGQIPNVFTYNSMIRGLCLAGKFDEAFSMLKEMEAKGIFPNFVVYSTLVSSLRNAGKLSEAHKLIKQMMQKGKYVHFLSRFKGKGYKR
ncbi:PREDICTED: pentatricopeptide repeat-containing protein At3g60050-like isoform X1 [Lupinus angustifolius]|uniref:pentatricopeptide repeat-containing protein At3g60050-like isoform X1 n=1 Tax=Lupinus angustifolius TaxID=3871 RepID=UPI00092E3BD3|nr:PREDICTED: pentatricopeptide repeat-containing protein At3g60050-like isoform X1 [Lupinus angustifolius]XP_019464841.1 PREDICTED: pentatricopeptide repeat-containing protein At3g60050-like isoform X1 [Lupinus angustifolius]XP_019464842.1 PREDICTED: pentatricopeptide repeat-containing protein At3g60050-like isoform X1 [Lupinus angustifolius]XP_019464864.1 PREDICTED: pentatricopeptide repeat-containing protein At3g60050-like isoform X1 [Lupinus angustifolius]XP_019464865.1 PREDICTED: pentatric